MAEVNLYNLDGSSAGQLTLSDALFAVKPKKSVIHSVIVAQDANSRQVLAHTKDRSEVRGGGKKPWRQKGTGRARHGSSRSPIWSGGGVTFGPIKDRVYTLKVNKSTKRLALCMVLTDKVQDSALIAVKDFTLPAAKTKLVAAMRQALPGAKQSALLVLAPGEEMMARAAKNIEGTEIIRAGSLNVRDIVKYRFLIVSAAGLAAMTETFAS
ncbi:TPA: 50S ribosomal protein L4 [Candidatus Uhrbacteria bacterium]|nr:50S ribosomal protein L4 [Candidatus Uhrbacteria bacterium]